MSATQDYVALDWIKGEISETLSQAQTSLEAASESPDDSTNLRACLTSIHQVHGTLKMLQLSSPVQIAGEMEELAQALMAAEVPDVEHAQEMLMQSILQMPSLLDRIQRDQSDSESVVLPLVNNLRGARGAELLEGDDSTSPSIDLRPFTDVANAQLDIFDAAGGTEAVAKLAARYRQALSALLKKNDPRDNIRLIAQVLNRLVRLTDGSPTGHLASVGVAVMEGVNGGGIRLDNKLAHLLRDVDTHHQNVVAQGLAIPVEETLAVSLLELVAASSKPTNRIEQVRETYLMSPQANEAVALGPDDETVSAVAGILME
ncbi:MAG: Hpt domain-containing protein, partial [Pseudomonadota bacterium]